MLQSSGSTITSICASANPYVQLAHMWSPDFELEPLGPHRCVPLVQPHFLRMHLFSLSFPRLLSVGH